MANEQNLIPNSKRTAKEVREHARKGGIKSGEVRRQKKRTQELLQEMLSKPIKDYAMFTEYAQQLGINETKSVKELFTVVFAMNSLKNGDFGMMEKMVGLLGESQQTDGVLDKLDKVIGEIDKLAK